MEQSDSDALAAACTAMPLFPLPGLVFLPSTLLPLHVFEPRYRALVKDCLAGAGIFAVPQLREGWQEEYEGRPAVWPMAGVGRIVRCQPLQDGRYNLLLLGMGRFHIDAESSTDTLYRVANGHIVTDTLPAGGEAALQPATEQLRQLVGQLITVHPGLAADFVRVLEHADGPVQLIDMLGHLALREAEERQTFLETADPLARCDQVLSGLAGFLSLSAGDPV